MEAGLAQAKAPARARAKAKPAVRIEGAVCERGDGVSLMNRFLAAEGFSLSIGRAASRVALAPIARGRASRR